MSGVAGAERSVDLDGDGSSQVGREVGVQRGVSSVLETSSGERERLLRRLTVGQRGEELGQAMGVEGLVRAGDRL